MTVDSEYPGYLPETREITVTEGQSTQDFVLEVDSTTCTAPGYTFNTTGTVTEDFNDGALPEGWTIDDNLENGQVWRFDDPDNRGNLTGGDGDVRDLGLRLLRQRSVAGHLARQPGDRHVRA